jgi:hypothetical protein
MKRWIIGQVVALAISLAISGAILWWIGGS